MLSSAGYGGPGGPPHGCSGDGKQIAAIASYAEPPVLTARVRLTEAGARRIPSAVLLPTGYQDTDGRLPVLWWRTAGGPEANSRIHTSAVPWAQAECTRKSQAKRATSPVVFSAFPRQGSIAEVVGKDDNDVGLHGRRRGCGERR